MGATDVYGSYSFVLKDLPGADDGLKFFQTDLPNGTVQVSGVKSWDGQGKPLPMHGGGHQATWAPISMTRYCDENTALYDWFKAVCDKGATDDTKHAPTITCLNNDVHLFMWTLSEAVATGYSQNAANAQTGDLLTETVTITYTTAEKS